MSVITTDNQGERLKKEKLMFNNE